FGEGRRMSKSRHTEAQIIAALKQVEAGRTVDDVARECSVSQATIYAWKAKYGGLEVSDAQRLRSLEDENSRLKRLGADLSFELSLSIASIRRVAARATGAVVQREAALWLSEITGAGGTRRRTSEP